MKRLVFILVLVLIGSESFGQQQGGWLIWSDQNYVASSKELARIVAKIKDGAKSGTWYKLNKRTNYQVVRPKQWISLLLKCYETNSVDNLISYLDQSDDMVWGDDFSSVRTKNYYWGSGGLDYVDNYSGLSARVPISVFGGKIRVKRNCGNGEEEYEVHTTYTPSLSTKKEPLKPLVLVDEPTKSLVLLDEPVKPLAVYKPGKPFPWCPVLIGTGVAAVVVVAVLAGKHHDKPAGGPGGTPANPGTGGDTGGPGGTPANQGDALHTSIMLKNTPIETKSVVIQPISKNTTFGIGVSRHGGSISLSLSF